MLIKRLTPLALCALIALPLHAVRTESLRFSDYTDFVSGELENVSLDNLGSLRAGPALQEIAVLDDANIWIALADDRGVLYLGTGADGVVYKLDPSAEEPKPEVVFKPDSIMTRAMALDKDGNLFIGTSPEGAVYRVAHGGRPEVFFDPQEIYIWDMIFDEEGNLYVATGSDARIFKLAPDHQLNAEVTPYFKSDRTHFTRLAWAEDGALIAGSGPKAYLYRITGEDKGEVLYSVGTDEIANVITRGKEVFFSTWHQDGGDDGPPKNLANLLARFQMKAPSSNGSDDDEGKKDETPAAKAPSFLLQLDADGFVSPVWSPGGANMQFMAAKGRSEFLVGSDQEGRLYTVRDADEWQLTNQAKRGGEVSSILPEVGPEKDTYVFTSNPAAIYRLGSDTEAESVFTGTPMDAGGVARWGKIRPLGIAKLGDGLTIETRSGNASEPDDTWSEWTALDEGSVASPSARYLQYRVNFKGDDVLDGLTVYYGTRNLAPLVGVINVMPVGLSVYSAESSNPITLNPKDLASESKTSKALKQERPTNQKVIVSDETGHVSVAWKAFDPNGDEMRYGVAIAPDGDWQWITLAEDLVDDVFSTPTRGYADGYYRFKVVATDSPSNLAGDAELGGMVSQPFLIDNESPEVKLHNQTTDADGNTVLVFAATDKWGTIVSANYRLNGKPPVDAIPTDLLFDSQEEVFRLNLGELRPAHFSIVFEAIDERGNRGLAKASFNVE